MASLLVIEQYRDEQYWDQLPLYYAANSDMCNLLTCLWYGRQVIASAPVPHTYRYKGAEWDLRIGQLRWTATTRTPVRGGKIASSVALCEYGRTHQPGDCEALAALTGLRYATTNQYEAVRAMIGQAALQHLVGTVISANSLATILTKVTEGAIEYVRSGHCDHWLLQQIASAVGPLSLLEAWYPDVEEVMNERKKWLVGQEEATRKYAEKLTQYAEEQRARQARSERAYQELMQSMNDTLPQQVGQMRPTVMTVPVVDDVHSQLQNQLRGDNLHPLEVEVNTEEEEEEYDDENEYEEGDDEDDDDAAIA